MISKKTLVYASILVVLACSLLAFFCKPKASLLEFVSPKDELPSYEARFPGDTSLSDRVIKSYALAMVLVQTPYTQNNVTALEMIREWARDQFHRHPDFLHPVSLIVDNEKRDTVFGAVGYNLLAPMKFWLEEQAAQLVRWRMSNFHGSKACQSFNKAYFDFFGKDSDTATMLALYESERGRQSVDVILWATVWLTGLFAGLAALIRNRKNDFFRSVQSLVAGAWLLIGLQYLFQAWDSAQNSSLLSAVLSIAIGAYLYRPFIVASHQEGGQQFLQIRLAPRWVALAAWLTFSIFAVQILTWVRTGLPNGSDPVTLLLCSATGNFIHEPIAGKRLITNIVAGLWLASTLWAWRQRDKSEPYGSSVEEGLRSLERSVDFQATL